MNKNILIIIVVVVVGIILYSIFGLRDIERQAWRDEMNNRVTDCNILEKTGASPNEVESCRLGIIKTARQDCMKYLLPEQCERMESVIDKQDLRDIFP